MTYLAFDPGNTTGWASFDKDAQPVGYGQVSFDELIDKLAEFDPPKVVIIEGFQLYRHKALQQSGSKLETVQAIGMIKAFARKWGAKVVEQPASILPIAQMWTQLKMPSNHAHSHWVSAYNHGAYYLVKQGVMKTAQQQAGSAQSDSP